jgi:cbb3-type cytochrome oxidase subunit 3
LFVTFVFIVLYVFGDKKRSQRLETYKNMPFLDDETEIKEDKK